MQSVKDSPFLSEAFYELNYSFGTYYLFDSFIVAEINEDVIYTWEEHGKIVVEDIIRDLYNNNGKELIYITNRINNYAVKPSDWIKFYANNFTLKGYGIVNYSKRSYFNSILEKIFANTCFKNFTSLEEAIIWAKKTTSEPASMVS